MFSALSCECMNLLAWCCLHPISLEDTALGKTSERLARP